MLDYRRTYMITDMTGSIDPPQLIGIAPRLFMDGQLQTLQYMTVSGTPGSNAHSIHSPAFIKEDDGSVIVRTRGGTDRWKFELLTLRLWKQHFSESDPGAYRYIVSDGAAQHYFWEQYVDEELWPENPV